MMEWTVNNKADKRSVVISDIIVDSLISIVDVPRGTVLLDPYHDYTISKEMLSQVLNNLHSGIEARRENNKRQAMKQLKLNHWQSWAMNKLETINQNDFFLNLLIEIESLCTYAIESQASIQVLGD